MKNDNARLKQNEERFRPIAESLPDAIIIADTRGIILFWNRAAEEIYGFAASEIIGKSIELLRPQEKRLVDRKNREQFLAIGCLYYIGKSAKGLALKKMA